MVAVSVLCAVALWATRILAAPEPESYSACTNSLSNSEVAAVEANFATHANTFTTSDETHRKTLTIPVYWHVIQRSNASTDGHLSLSEIKKSLAVVNKAFKPAGLNFQLKGRDYSTNDTWFQLFGPTTVYNKDAKTALHRGTKKTLNIYSTGFAHRNWRGLSGYATFPWDVANALALDGVVFRYTTRPGGSDLVYNGGKVLVHEIGHWVGLYHTFQGDCGSPGDLVSDTPDQELPASGCPVKQDSCPDQKGLDPIHNYMDYSSDDCRTSLTKGQIKRLRAQIATYRGLR